METLADRLKWVVKKERLFPSYNQWAAATENHPTLKRVHVNTLNDLKNAKTENAETDTIRALAAATRNSEKLKDTGRCISDAWLQFGKGTPYGAEQISDPVYPSRTAAVLALQAYGAPSTVIERLLRVGGHKSDPGISYWLRKAAEFHEDFDRANNEGRVIGQ